MEYKYGYCDGCGRYDVMIDADGLCGPCGPVGGCEYDERDQRIASLRALLDSADDEVRTVTAERDSLRAQLAAASRRRDATEIEFREWRDATEIEFRAWRERTIELERERDAALDELEFVLDESDYVRKTRDQRYIELTSEIDALHDEIASLEAALEKLESECKELRSAAEMACIDPLDDCDCAGCLSAAEFNQMKPTPESSAETTG